MVRYKTVLTDYEGLQRCLDDSSESGWQLFSVTPDTWRKMLGTDEPADALESIGVQMGEASAQYCASYYLVILFRDDIHEYETVTAAASEELTLEDYQTGSY